MPHTVKNAVIKLLLLCAFCGFVLLFWHCPFRLLFGIDCPTCGMTRAFLALAQLDLGAALRFHPLCIPTALVCGYLVLRRLLPRRIPGTARTEALSAGLLAVLLIAVWLCRLPL